MGNLSNLYVSRSFQSLIHLATDNTASANLIGLEDGYGNPIGVSVNTAGDLSISGSFTASLQNGYVWVGNSSGTTTTVATSSFGGGSVPAGTISGSAQITALGFVSSSITASSLITASFDNGTRNLTFTKGDNTTFAVNIPDVSGSAGNFVTTSSFNDYTASVSSSLGNLQSQLTTIGTQSGSWGVASGSVPLGTVSSSAQILAYNIFATTGSNTFIGNQIINGAVSISSSATYDLDVTGAIRISGAGTPQLLITGSTVGLSTTITATQLGIVSASVSSGVTSKVIASSDTTGTPTTSKYLGFSSNPSQTGISSLSTISEPSIIAASGSSAGAFYTPITFQRIGTWTDGRVTFNNPIVGLRSLELTGSFTASLTQGYTWVGNGNNISTLVATSSFGGGGGSTFPYTGTAEITGSLIVSGSSTFIGNQTISGALNISGNIKADAGPDYGNIELIRRNQYGSSTSFTMANGVDASLTMGADSTFNIGASGGNTTLKINNGSNTGTASLSFDVSSTGGNDILSFAASNTNNTASLALIDANNSINIIRFEQNPEKVTVYNQLVVSGSIYSTGSITIQSGSGDLYVHGHKQFNCGAWQDTTTQSGSANTAYAFKFNTTDVYDGVILSGSTGLQATAAGIYNIQWSGQLVQGASSAEVTVWLRKNGTDISGTGGRITMASNTKLLPAWNYVLELATNDVIELMWASDSSATTWEYIPAATIYPACASIIATISQVR